MAGILGSTPNNNWHTDHRRIHCSLSLSLLFPLVLRAVPPAKETVLPDIIRTSLAAGAGFGAVATLIIALRRQWSSEDAASKRHANEVDQRIQRQRIAEDERLDRREANRIPEHDALERRLTEMFGRAAEQLGHDKAPVRIAGIYALERLADGNETQRVVVLNVLLAYLRMPYAPPGDEPSEAASAGQIERWREASNEANVRETAQHTLYRHRALTMPSRFWAADELDLSGASLLGLEFAEADLAGARMVHSTLSGAKLRRSKLSRTHFLLADLSATDLRESQLDKAILAGADLRNADLRKSDLVGADLEGADLRHASIDGANVSGADLRFSEYKGLSVAGVKWSSNTRWPIGIRAEIEANSVQDVTKESTEIVQFWEVRATFMASSRAW